MSKITQAEANYRRGDPINSCGVCVYYQGKHRCSQVMGDISPFGVSDVYKADQDNPFGPSLTANERAQIKTIAANAANRADQGGGQPQPPQGGAAPPQPRPFFQ